MAQNIEVKLRVDQLQPVRERALQVADQGPFDLDQVDHFFTVPTGRLKLRVEQSNLPGHENKAELIAYHRADEARARSSEYVLYATDNPDRLREALASSLGTGPVVRKRRELFLVGLTRIHLDTVEGLGTFVEIEVVLSDGKTADDGQQELELLLNQLHLSSNDVESIAYAEML